MHSTGEDANSVSAIHCLPRAELDDILATTIMATIQPSRLVYKVIGKQEIDADLFVPDPSKVKKDAKCPVSTSGTPVREK